MDREQFLNSKTQVSEKIQEAKSLAEIFGMTDLAEVLEIIDQKLNNEAGEIDQLLNKLR